MKSNKLTAIIKINEYKLNYKFPENGKYSIGVLQAMRMDNLPGIEDIGIKIETVKP